MKAHWKRIYWITGLFLTFLLACVCMPFAVLQSRAEEQTQKVLRVGLAEVAGFSEQEEDGSWHGLILDYLNEISKYTGWEYEYIESSGEELTTRFIEGQFDLMGGAYYSPGLEKYFNYPKYSTGRTRSVLLADWEDESIRGFDYSELNGKTIAVHSRATENIRRLEEFLSMNKLECTIVPYDPEVSGYSLHPFVESGQTDLMLGNQADDDGTLRAVAYFEAQPHYLVTQPEDTETLETLNWALTQILESNPNYADERYEANFPYVGLNSVTLNKAEKAYIQEKGSLLVAVPKDYYPFYCRENQEIPYDGLVEDMMQEVSAYTGLSFEYVYVDTYAECLEAVRQGRADLAGFYIGSEESAAEDGLSISRFYTTMTNLIIRNKESVYPSAEGTVALVEGWRLPEDIVADEVLYFPDSYHAMQAVNRGEADYVYDLSVRAEMEMQQHYLSNLVPVFLPDSNAGISFALAKPAQAELLTILNKTITGLSEERREDIANRRLVSMNVNKFSLTELIYSNPILFAFIMLGILLLFAFMYMAVTRARVRAILIQGELERVEAESHAKSEFLSRMSHEIRTPMNAIVGLGELIGRTESLPDKTRDYVDKLKGSSRYLLSLLNDVLDMSRIDNGKMELTKESFSLTRMLAETRNMLHEDAVRREIQYVETIQIEHDRLYGDVTRLQQVLVNLLGNALKFTGKGGKIQLFVEEQEVEGECAAFSFRVTDTGAGIPKEDQERIFQAFEQGKNQSPLHQGTGLGLPISRSIVEKMGGSLQLKSEPGAGSEFYFKVSICLDKSRQKAKGVEAEVNLLEGKQILLVEDNDINAMIAQELLEVQGAEVVRARDGVEAVKLFAESAEGTYTLILMDIRMPRMDGVEATRQIRALERVDAGTVLIVAMSANSLQEEIAEAEKAGMNEYIMKPLDVNRLFEQLQELLAQQKY